MKHSLKRRFQRKAGAFSDISPAMQAHMLDVLERAKDVIIEKWLDLTDRGTPAGEIAAMIREDHGEVNIAVMTIDKVPSMLSKRHADAIMTDARGKLSSGLLPVIYTVVDQGMVALLTIDVEPMKLVPPVEHRVRITSIIEANKRELLSIMLARMTALGGTEPLIGLVSNGPAGIKLSAPTLDELAAFVPGDAIGNVMTVAMQAMTESMLPILYIEGSAGIVSLVQLGVDMGAVKIASSISSPGGQA